MTQIPQTTIVFPKDCIKYCIEGHPESPKRVESIYNALIDKFEFVDAQPAKKEDILLCHTEEHYNRVLNKGLIIGFGAGDITYQLRNFV